jgi:Zn-dependent peptidase ImmA (M78 family)
MGQVCKAKQYNIQQSPLEREAGYFAGYFLAPDEAIEYLLLERKGSLSSIQLSDCIYLEQYFRISHSAMNVSPVAATRDNYGARKGRMATWSYPCCTGTGL